MSRNADDGPGYLVLGAVKVRQYRPAKSHKRMYVVECGACGQWATVPTLELQAECRRLKQCPKCQHNEVWRATVKVEAIRAHMAALVKRGQALPDGPARDRLRAIYVSKMQQLAQAEARLATVRATREVTV